MRHLVVAAVAALVLAHPRADARADGEHAILFARGASLWEASLAAGAEAVEIAALPRSAGAARRITASAGGERILVETSAEVLVVSPRPGEVVTPRALPCSPPAQLALRGDAVLCRREDDAVRVDLEVPVVSVIEGAGGAPVRFLGPDSKTAVVADGSAICALSLPSGRRRCLAPHSPRSGDVLGAPSGDRAVATYRRGDREALYSFRLDGRGVRRSLMSEARAVAWSLDSKWLAVQRGGRACLVRAVGGQYKCWRGYRAVALAPDGQRLLLARGEGPRALYVAPLAGARPAPPRALVEDAGTGAAAWITRAQSPSP
jgi:hypothetical protein